jgi:hypothetical protein
MLPARKGPASGCDSALTSPEMKVTTRGAEGGLPALAECAKTNTPMPAKPIHNATFVILFIIVTSANDYKNFYFLLNFVSQGPIRITVGRCPLYLLLRYRLPASAAGRKFSITHSSLLAPSSTLNAKRLLSG